MTHQEFDKRLDETIDRVYLYGMNGGLGYEKFEKELSPKEAKQAIRELFLDAIGDDLPIGDEIAEGRSYTGERLHNKIKAQLRTTITGKEGGDE